MDVFTHFLLPFALLTLLRRPVAERFAAGIGGYAPDLDVLWTWVPRVAPEAWVFVHRGWSHTVWGGALLAIGLLFVLTRAPLVRRFPRLSGLAFGRETAAVAVFGALTHVLLLDFVTITGTPAFWPATETRFAGNLFFWSVSWALLPSLVVLVLLWRRKIGERGILVGALVVLVVIGLSGGVRAATYPDVEDGGFVVPTGAEWTWLVASPAPGGWNVSRLVWGEAEETRAYVGNATAEAASAIEACRATGVYKAWRWGGLRAEVANATAVPGGFRVVLHDAVSRFEFDTGGFGPFRSDTPYDPEERGVRCTIVDGGVVEAVRPNSFWG